MHVLRDLDLLKKMANASVYFPEIAAGFKESAFSIEHAYWGELRRRLEDLRSKDNLNLRIHI